MRLRRNSGEMSWKIVHQNFNGDNLPVENISWNESQDFIQKINDKEGGGNYVFLQRQNGNMQCVQEL